MEANGFGPVLLCGQTQPTVAYPDLAGQSLHSSKPTNLVGSPGTVIHSAGG